MSKVSLVASRERAQQTWVEYLRRQDDLIGAARLGNWLSVAGTAINYYGLHQTKQAIERASRDQIAEARENTREILSGLADIEAQISSSVGGLRRVMDLRLGLIEDQIAISNAIARNILEILHVPEFQKERRYYYEQGLRHYANARFDDELHKEALACFWEAERREGADPQVLYRIGLIYLYSPSECNLSKAEDYLTRAARFASINAQPGALVQPYVLRLVDDNNMQDSHIRFAAAVFSDLSVVLLTQGKEDGAATAAETCVKFDPSYIPGRLQQLRCVSVTASTALSQAMALQLLRETPEIAIGIARDDSLLADPGVQTALREIQTDRTRKALGKAPQLLKRFDGLPDAFKQVGGSLVEHASALTETIKTSTNTDTVGAAAAALDTLLAQPNPELDFSHPELVTELKTRGEVQSVHFVEGGRGCVVVSTVPGSEKLDEYGGRFPSRVDLLAINVDGAFSKMTRREVALSSFAPVAGVLARDGRFLLEGAAMLFDAHDLAQSSQLSAAPSCPVFFGGEACEIRDDPYPKLIRLSDRQSVREFPVGEYVAFFDEGRSELVVEFDRKNCQAEDIVIFHGKSGREGFPHLKIFDLASNRSADVIVQMRGNEKFYAAERAVASSDRTRIAVQLTNPTVLSRITVIVNMLDGSHSVNIQSWNAPLMPFRDNESLFKLNQGGSLSALIHECVDLKADSSGIAIAAWKDNIVKIGPGPAACALGHAADLFRLRLTVSADALKVTTGGASIAHTMLSESPAEESTERFVAAFRERQKMIDLMSLEAKTALTAAAEREGKERRRWLGKKDWDAVRQLYRDAGKLGYPYAEEDVARLRYEK